jgi:hypothetical protein
MATLSEIVQSFRTQAGWCDRLGSPFTARLLECAAVDLERAGSLNDLVGVWPGDPVADALPLRFAGALHALVLSSTAPGLAATYPPQLSAPPDAAVLWPAVLAAVRAHRKLFEIYLALPPQTNEVSRSAVLLGGFLEVARLTAGRLPLRLLEIGASAGLNLLWNRYHYALGECGSWGDPASPVRIATRWTGPLSPSLDIPAVQVAERAACDVSPIDVGDAAQRLRLRSYVWADQRERLARLDDAIGVACRAGIHVEQADAGSWVEDRLSRTAEGRATVLYHSIMWQYMPRETHERIGAAVAAASRRARSDASLAWLRFEPPAPDAAPELRLTIWPDGEERLLARAHPHGASVRWLAGIAGSERE